MFEFAWLWALLLLPLPLLYRLLPRKQSAQAAVLRAPIWHMHKQAAAEPNQGKVTRLILPSFIWLLLVLAAARPQYLGEPVSLPTEGRDIMLAVDLSGSMQAEDMTIKGRQVDRLTMTKHVMQDFITRRSGDRLGLILFADTAYLQTPLTRDLNTVQQLLKESILGLVGEKTAIGDAIGLAAKRFKLQDESNRILVLLTDGQNTAGNLEPAEALELAKAEGIKIYTIGVASDQVLSRGFFGFGTQRADADLDEGLLQQLAKETGGQYFRAKSTGQLEKIYEVLDELEPIAAEEVQMRPLTALFYWPLGLALLLSLLPVLSAISTTLSWPWQKPNAKASTNNPASSVIDKGVQ
ncbi:IMP dehydrogenase [Saccharobesus litoralis]|uniref:IMP dehydrogenase n=1 Tax=Saccharobesus litoralis TaxID=2172099 RepID=A0A2S0VSF5_9ALTE|nr:VWA domain-containing protein [Saccharobesus litoralis]AWB67151.1 IMP dehydrogenase [Saccharobesus litoralis]